MTITLTREEAQQVLDALSKTNAEWKHLADSGDAGNWAAEDQDHYQQCDTAIKTLRARLSAPEPPCKTGSQCIGGKCPQCVVSEPEPVAWMNESDMGRTDWKVWAHGKPTATIPLYTAPKEKK
jgi:hypothetical protein